MIEYGAQMISTVYVFMLGQLQASVAVTVKVNVPFCVGVPCSIPPMKLKPGGRVPVTEYVTVGHGLLFAKVCLGYGLPAVPGGSTVG